MKFRIQFTVFLVTTLTMLLAPMAGTSVAAETVRTSDPKAHPAVIQPAIDGIFEAFASRPLVGLGEVHGVSQILDFYREIVRDPRFAANVGNVVVEFGGGAHQAVIDRYVEGEQVSYAELRKVWTETVGWQPTVLNEEYALFLAQVRQVNLALPRGKRIKVWLGEPPIDWSKIRDAEAYKPILATRDSYPAELIMRHILSQGRKALVIYGRGHFDASQPWEIAARAEIEAADPGGPMSQGADPSLRDLVEAQYPESFFVAQAYRGFEDEECTRRFEERMKGWPMPALAVSVHDTTLERDIRLCLKPKSLGMRFPPSIPAAVQERVRALVVLNADRDQPLISDSIIFYAPSPQLTRASPFLEFAMDEEWRAELSRRNEIIAGRPVSPEWGRSLSSGKTPYTQRD